MQLRFLIPVMLAGVLSATGAFIEASARCQAGPGTSSGGTGCFEHYQPPPDSPYYWSFAEAQASGAGNDSVKRQGYDYGATVTTSAHAYAHGFDDYGNYLTASSSSDVSLKQWFTTSGPVREGWIDLLIDGDGDWDYGGGTGATGSVGPYHGGLWGPYINGRYTFTLGQPFLLELSSYSSGSGLGSNGGFGSNIMGVFFRLYEADLSSNVIADPLAVPEPAASGVVGALALVVVHFIRRRRFAVSR